ncbi:Nucleoside diphosphate kinase [archaeon HR06]|nr:Nucleoside diphosphate kinase [archaeon HR06]
MIEQTLIVIKPDGVQRGLVGEILSRFEKKGFKIKALKMLNFSREMAEDFYSPHKDKAFFNDLINFIISGPVVAAILEGSYAISVVRSMIGSTKSYEALPGTIRGDYGLGVTDNIIHASDSKESFEREAKIIFK